MQRAAYSPLLPSSRQFFVRRTRISYALARAVRLAALFRGRPSRLPLPPTFPTYTTISRPFVPVLDPESRRNGPLRSRAERN